MQDCGRDIPQGTGDEIAAQAASYPATSEDFGELHDIQFPYWNACQVIAACRDIAAMLRSDLEKRGDVAERGGRPGEIVYEMTADGAGGWRSGNVETIGLDAAWSAQRSGIEGFVETLDTLAGGLEDVWDEVVAANGSRGRNRADYDAWNATQVDLRVEGIH